MWRGEVFRCFVYQLEVFYTCVHEHTLSSISQWHHPSCSWDESEARALSSCGSDNYDFWRRSATCPVMILIYLPISSKHNASFRPSHKSDQVIFSRFQILALRTDLVLARVAILLFTIYRACKKRCGVLSDSNAEVLQDEFVDKHKIWRVSRSSSESKPCPGNLTRGICNLSRPVDDGNSSIRGSTDRACCCHRVFSWLAIQDDAVF